MSSYSHILDRFFKNRRNACSRAKRLKLTVLAGSDSQTQEKN